MITIFWLTARSFQVVVLAIKRTIILGHKYPVFQNTIGFPAPFCN